MEVTCTEYNVTLSKTELNASTLRLPKSSKAVEINSVKIETNFILLGGQLYWTTTPSASISCTVIANKWLIAGSS